MRPRASLGDEFVPHLAREGQVDERVAVEVAKLALSEAELDPAEAVRCGSTPGHAITAAAIRPQMPALSPILVDPNGRCHSASPAVVRVFGSCVETPRSGSQAGRRLGDG